MLFSICFTVLYTRSKAKCMPKYYFQINLRLFYIRKPVFMLRHDKIFRRECLSRPKKKTIFTFLFALGTFYHKDMYTLLGSAYNYK